MSPGKVSSAPTGNGAHADVIVLASLGNASDCDKHRFGRAVGRWKTDQKNQMFIISRIDK